MIPRLLVRTSIFGLTCLSLAGAARAGVVDPWIATDQSVDCRSMETIRACLAKDGMPDEARVLAAFHWFRRNVSHGHGGPPAALLTNFNWQINVFGCGASQRQAEPLAQLWEQMGYRTRGWKVGTATTVEVSYGGRWHLLEPHMNFFVYDRETPRNIASVEQIRRDPALVTEAVKEGRACPGFLLCGDPVEMFTATNAWQAVGSLPGVDATPEPFGRITLRRGESYVRTWQPGPYAISRFWPEGFACHSCSRKDAQDTVNAPFLEPNVWVNVRARYYRHGGAGRLVYAPDLTGDHLLDAAVAHHNLAPGSMDHRPVWMPAAAGQSGDVTLNIECPYALAAGELQLERTGTGILNAAVSLDKGRTWVALPLFAASNTFSCAFFEPINGTLQGYWLRLGVAPETGIAGLQLTTHFLLNPTSLPYLVPGTNRVSVSAGRMDSPLTVSIQWAEGSEWKEPRTFSRTCATNGSFEVTVGGDKYPRMDELRLSVAP